MASFVRGRGVGRGLVAPLGCGRSRRWRSAAVKCWCCCLAASLVSLAVAQAASSPTWKVVAVLRPAHAGQAVLVDVSCVSQQACVAVGGSYYLGDLIEREVRGSWSQEAIARPGSDRSGFQLNGVSCVSLSWCVAVGTDDSRDASVVMQLRGSRWSTKSAPSPGVYSDALAEVSCTSRSFCIAVGWQDNRALVERWNGSRWALAHGPFPRGASLNGVSCTSRRACIAVGDGGVGAVAARWNGKRWRSGRIFRAGGLGSVSCSAADRCLAVSDAGLGRRGGTAALGPLRSCQCPGKTCG